MYNRLVQATQKKKKKSHSHAAFLKYDKTQMHLAKHGSIRPLWRFEKRKIKIEEGKQPSLTALYED